MPTGIRRLIRAALSLVGRVLYLAGAARLVIRLRGRTPRVVEYHACEASENDFIRGLNSNTTPRDLSGHLDFYRRYYNVISLEDLERGRLPDRALAITFDDGYRSVWLGAVPALRTRKIPATVYLVTDVVDNRTVIWVNELNWYLQRHGTPARTLACRHLGLPPSSPPSTVLAVARDRYDHGTLRVLLDALRGALGDGARAEAAREHLYLSWAEVAAMRAAGIAIGNHTASHPNLARLTPSEVREAIAAAQDALAAHGVRATSFAYPFGATAEGTARDAGFASIMAVGGSNCPFRPGAVARVPVHARTPSQLFAEVELSAPVLATARRLVRRAGIRLPGRRIAHAPPPGTHAPASPR